jgi:deoxyribodipyrimidine photolyase-related protein
LPTEPADARLTHDHTALWRTIVAAGVSSFGEASAAQLAWPLDRGEALQQLDALIDRALLHFGAFQDAMSHRAWRMFHSLLSFARNTKMLDPREVVARADAAWRAGSVSLATADGFIRQIIGWREYVRGFYWAHMPDYGEHHVFGHSRPLPQWFWTGTTRMRCLAHAIGQSLELAYAHHIQRLMVIGNFALLAGLHPAAVHRWDLGVYVDAFEWVELPNTLGMSQFADGGLLASKPYVSSAAYIDRMSDYCRGCHYDRKLRSALESRRLAQPVTGGIRTALAWRRVADRRGRTLAVSSAVSSTAGPFPVRRKRPNRPALDNAPRLLASTERLPV